MPLDLALDWLPLDKHPALTYTYTHVIIMQNILQLCSRLEMGSLYMWESPMLGLDIHLNQSPKYSLIHLQQMVTGTANTLDSVVLAANNSLYILLSPSKGGFIQ